MPKDPIPPPEELSERLFVRITPDQREQLESIADDRGVTISHVARSLLIWALRELEKQG